MTPPAKPKHAGGRPKTRTAAEIKNIQQRICYEISTTTNSIKTILKKLKPEIDKCPDLSQVMVWLNTDGQFNEQYARAKADQCGLMAEEILDIADDSSLDMAFTEEGKSFVDRENINRSRLRVDTRKWLLSKLVPKKWGDYIKSDINMQADINMHSMSDDELNARIAQALKYLK